MAKEAEQKAKEVPRIFFLGVRSVGVVAKVYLRN